MTDERQGAAWRALPRLTKHRTSGPTNSLVRAAVNRIAEARDGRPFARPSADAVIYAALRLVDRDALLAEVEVVEALTFSPAEAAQPADD